jgi:hypothetical protein
MDVRHETWLGVTQMLGATRHEAKSFRDVGEHDGRRQAVPRHLQPKGTDPRA